MLIQKITLNSQVSSVIKIMQRVGFEPTKRYASELKSDPFDHSGIFAIFTPPMGLEPMTTRLRAVRSTN